MKKRLEYVLKHNVVLQKLFKATFSIFFRFLGLFLKTNPNMILFNSFGGRLYNDSPKEIFEYMLKQEKFRNFDFIWAFEEPNKFDIPNCRKIKIDTLAYFITALKAKFWISSVNIERGLHFKKKNTVFLNTWHGIPLKKIGNSSGGKYYDYSNVDYLCISGRYDKQIFLKDLKAKKENLLYSGMPRNDALYHLTTQKIKELRKRFEIPDKKKVILYAPTWRDSVDGGQNFLLKPPVNFKKWKDLLEEKYVVLFRAHIFTTKLLDVSFDEFVMDYSRYPDINHLLLLADILISDYSATIFDYSILERPIICFGYDYDNYEKDRGFYLNLEEELPSGVIKNERELLTKITTMDYRLECEKTSRFKNKYLEVGGNATEICVNILSQHIGN